MEDPSSTIQFSSHDLDDDWGYRKTTSETKKKGALKTWDFSIYDVTFVLVLKVHESSPKVVYMEAPMVKAWKMIPTNYATLGCFWHLGIAC